MATKKPAGKTFSTTLPDGLAIERMLLTPDIAKDWIDQYGIKESTLSKNKVKSIVDDIEGGRWNDQAAITDPIVFSKPATKAASEPLKNGRKRIVAVAKCGIPVWVYVVRGATRNIERFLNLSTNTPVPSFLKWHGGFRHINIVSTLAYFKVRITQNNYDIARSLHGNGGTHASRNAALECALTDKDVFEKYADTAISMQKSTKDKAAEKYARFIWLVNAYGANAHKAAIKDFCMKFSTDPNKDVFVKSAVDTINNRIARLHPYEPLDSEWVVGVLLKALEGRINTKSNSASAVNGDPADVADMLAAWEGRVKTAQTIAPKA